MAAETLTTWLDELTLRAGATPAIDYEGRTIGFEALATGARKVARGLADLGVAPGDRVAVWLPNAPAWLELLFACGRLGAIAVAVNTRFRAAELGDILARSGAKVLVLWPGFKGIDFPAILGRVEQSALSALEAIVAYDEGDAAAATAIRGRITVSYRHIAGAQPYAGDHGKPKSGCIIFTTSGTTSLPKFVLHEQRGLVRHANAVAPALGYDERDAVMLQALPLCGTFGLSQALASFAACRPMVLMQTFEAKRAADLVRQKSITHMNGSDEMYRRLLDERGGTRPFPSFRQCGFAAFNASPEDVMAMGEARGLPLVGLYGMSEVQALFAARAPSAPASERMRGGGRPVSALSAVRVRDPASGEVLPHGSPGELEIKGPSVMKEYFGDRAATREAFTEDGYLRTGDLGYSEEGGGFTFLARMGDALRLGGYLVSPEEIAAHLERHGSVAAAQVVGLEGERGIEAVAFVRLANGQAFSEAALKEHCAAGLARFKVPARIFEIEDFPVAESANGVKVQRGRLRAIAKTLLAAG